MPEVTELLESLADRPPSYPPPVDTIRARARGRQRRRQRTMVAGLGLVLAFVAGVVLTSDEDRTDLGTDAPDSATSVPTLPTANGLDLSPAADLRDGEEVTLTLPSDPGGEVVVKQCAAEWLDEEITDWWCGGVYTLRSPAGRPDLVMPVARILETPQGTVDCAEAPGRCLLFAGENWPGHCCIASFDTRRIAPLAFGPELGLPPEPALRLVGIDGPIADGQRVRVEGSGFGARDDVFLTQCAGATCDTVRSAELFADDDGTFAVDVLVFHDIATYDDHLGPLEWLPCEPCVLTATLAAPDEVAVALDLAPTDDPIHPALQIPDGPRAPGEKIRIEGAGFQASTVVDVGVCLAGSVDCVYPDEGFPRTDAQGRFTVDAFPLPTVAHDFGNCRTTPGTCVIAWGPSEEGAPLGIEVPLDLTG